MQTVRVLGAVLGGLIALGTSASVLQTLVMPGGRVGRLFKVVDRVLDVSLRLAGRALPHYRDRSRVLSFQAPVVLAVLLLLWLSGYLLAYGLLLWPAVGNLAAALRESGSSLLTPGFASTRAGGPTAIDFVAGATGLIVVALQIAYLPALYGAFNRRETEVTLLGVRAGLPAWGPELLARSTFTITTEELPDFYRQWERWEAEVAETHSSYPILLRFRSPDPIASWLISLLAVMDSAALWSGLLMRRTLAPTPASSSAGGSSTWASLGSNRQFPHDPHPGRGLASLPGVVGEPRGRPSQLPQRFPADRLTRDAKPHSDDALTPVRGATRTIDLCAKPPGPGRVEVRSCPGGGRDACSKR